MNISSMNIRSMDIRSMNIKNIDIMLEILLEALIEHYRSTLELLETPIN